MNILNELKALNTSIEDCKKDTLDHKNKVKEYMDKLSGIITDRGLHHDDSKLKSPELEVYAEYVPKLKQVEYNSDEYKEYLKQMKVALDSHYSNNRHHPEYHNNGIKDMSLIDILEMLVDWKASIERGGNKISIDSLNTNQERFGYSDELKQIMMNTINLLEDK